MPLPLRPQVAPLPPVTGAWGRRCVLIIALAATLVKAGLVLSHQGFLVTNPDERYGIITATNHLNGQGYTLFDKERGILRPTAFRPSFTLFVFEGLLAHRLPIGLWTGTIWALTLVAYFFSIPAFHRLLQRFVRDGRVVNAALCTYVLFPSMFYFIGILFQYENLALFTLVILVDHACGSFAGERSSRWQLLLFTAIPVLSCLLRPQLLPCYALLLLVLLVRSLRTRRMDGLLHVALVSLALVAVHIPILRKNHALFGAYILSTQSGFELLQGHNPTARGSWMGEWRLKGSPNRIYAEANIPGLAGMDEREESRARKALALAWIRSHPKEELVLTLRKLAIFFRPHNYEVLPGYAVPNPINAAVYLLFLIALVVHPKRWWRDGRVLLVSIPILTSLALCVIFFTGYRWRYYAEPFMVLFAAVAVDELVRRYKHRHARRDDAVERPLQPHA